MKETGNLIVDLTFDFSLKIVEFTSKLEEIRKFPLSNQLFKSGTSIGANVRESQSAESKNDFVHKLKISAKEAEETEYWLLLCKHSEHLPDPANLLEQINRIQKVLSSIISSAKKRL